MSNNPPSPIKLNNESAAPCSKLECQLSYYYPRGTYFTASPYTVGKNNSIIFNVSNINKALDSYVLLANNQSEEYKVEYVKINNPSEHAIINLNIKGNKTESSRKPIELQIVHSDKNNKKLIICILCSIGRGSNGLTFFDDLSQRVELPKFNMNLFSPINELYNENKYAFYLYTGFFLKKRQ